MMVLAYSEDGDLRKYLKNNFSNLKWKKKLEILENISYSLHSLHKLDYTHKDLHSGNVLMFKAKSTIIDLGLAQLVHDSDPSKICGVLTYMAPEVLIGKEYTFASDIYSFGIIMTEISTGNPPHGNVPHENLQLEICKGLRPSVAKGTPQCYIDLVNQCLDANPEKRPSAEKLYEIIRSWFGAKPEKNPEIFKKFNDADEIILQDPPSKIALHPRAIYTSNYMKFNNIPEPINSVGVQVENQGTVDCYLVL